jgi:hypothetical protein
MPKHHKQQETIAERQFLSHGTVPPTPVTVRVFAPRRVDGSWVCDFAIIGAKTISNSAFGEDSMQALQMALEGLRVLLASADAPLSWCGQVGFLGLPMSVPISYGLVVQRELEEILVREERRIIERELDARRGGPEPKDDPDG